MKDKSPKEPNYKWGKTIEPKPFSKSEALFITLLAQIQEEKVKDVRFRLIKYFKESLDWEREAQQKEFERDKEEFSRALVRTMEKQHEEQLKQQKEKIREWLDTPDFIIKDRGERDNMLREFDRVFK